MRGQALLAVGALASALLVAQPAAAEHYPGQSGYYVSADQTLAEQQCRDSRNGRMAAGAAIGAIAGAVLGNNVARHQGDGTVAGAVIGGLAGGAIGRSTARCNTQPYQQGYNQPYQQPYQGQPYRGDDSGLYGGPYTPSSYGRQSNRNCRWGEQILRDPDGYEYREQVYMCRGRDGVWRAQR